jgi:hypothetical protein
VDVIAETSDWVERFVIGLGLCPFATEPHRAGRVRYVESSARSSKALLSDLRRELTDLARVEPASVETTLLIHPFVLSDFLEFNAFLDLADVALVEGGLVGTIQIASFHPEYQFAGVAPDDVANATNRSPYPMLHLIREESITRALDGYGEGEDIPRRNVQLLRELGATEVARRGGRV